MATKNYLRLQNFIRRICCGLFGLALCACVASYTFISFFGNNLLGTSFSPVNELLPWMYLGIIIGASLIWSHPLAVALNRADISFKASLFGSVIGLGTFWSLTAVYGVIGSSIAWSLTLLLTFTFTAILSINLLTNQMRQK